MAVFLFLYPFFYPLVIYGLLTFCLLCPFALSVAL
nr:MAG TPA: hypothetical protein [Caudoviricetes sp.]